MRVPQALLLSVLALPLSAQAWDLRVEVPYPTGESLPQTLLGGTKKLVQKNLDTGTGIILTASHRIVRVGPVLKLEWGGELTDWQANGHVQQDTFTYDSRLRQTGLGVDLNAQFWVPFTGLAGEFGLLERVQVYRLEVNGLKEQHVLARPWLRVGIRYSFPLDWAEPYLAASYQEPITKDNPVKLNSTSDLASYLDAQGSGQEFRRMWTFGIGVTF